jgi:hypothetical protein
MITLILMGVFVLGGIYYFVDLKGEDISPLIRAVKNNQISFCLKRQSPLSGGPLVY